MKATDNKVTYENRYINISSIYWVGLNNDENCWCALIDWVTFLFYKIEGYCGSFFM